MKYSKKVYIDALESLAKLRARASEKEKFVIDFYAEAIAEMGDRDNPIDTAVSCCSVCKYQGKHLDAIPCTTCPAWPQKGDEGGPCIPDYIYRDMRKLANGGCCELCAKAGSCDARGSTFQNIFCPDWKYNRLPPDDGEAEKK